MPIYLRRVITIALVAFGLMVPTSVALATGQTTLTRNGATPTSIAAGDQMSVVMDGPLLTVGQTTQRLTALWSPESLQLKDNNITYPAGWGLEYTVDGTTWTSSVPLNLSTVTGIRASGSVNATGVNIYQTSGNPTIVNVTSGFTGSSGGDGLNLIFAGDRVFNVFHHDTSIRIDCHLVANGNACYSPAVKQFTGYSTGNASQGYWYGPESKLYIQAAKDLATDQVGFVCVDYSTIATPVLCTTPWFPLGTTADGTVATSANHIGTSAQIGTKIYVPNVSTWKLQCFDMATSAACSSNGFDLSNGGSPGGLTEFGRASAIEGKIYFATYGYIGCFDPALNSGAGGYCGGASGGIVEATHASQYPLIPIRNSSGTLTGVCFLPTQACMTPNTNTSASLMPSVLATWESATPVPSWNTYNAGMWAEQGNKLYLNQGTSGTATSNIYCYDFTSSAACTGSSYTAGVASNVGTEIYFIQNDPTVANCIWTIGNSGVIKTFNGLTGAAGCTAAHPMADLPYTATVPRMSCADSGRVIAWQSIKIDPLSTGIALTDVRVTVFDTYSNAISSYVELTPNTVTGIVDLSGLTTGTTGLHPVFRIADFSSSPTAGAVANVRGVVSYEATNPQLCFNMQAAQTCPNVTPSQSDPTVPDGLIRTVILSTPSSGPAQDQTENITLAGTNTSSACSATLLGVIPTVTPPSSTPSTPAPPATTVAELPHTGINPVQSVIILLAGLVLLSMGGAALHMMQRKKS